MRFNTIVHNSGPGAGVGCAGPSSMSDTIVFANSSFAGSQLDLAGCTLGANVVTGLDGAPGAVLLSPVFMGAVDFRLVPGNADDLACCIDKATVGPALDVTGAPRPRGAGYDVGAYEVP